MSTATGGGSRDSMIRSHLVLLSILLLAAGLRVHDLTRHALWVDELLTLEGSAGHGFEYKLLHLGGNGAHPPDLLGLAGAGPWWRIITTVARDDIHPPLYALLIRAWRIAFGDSDAALRSFSVLVSVAAVALLYAAVRPLHGSAAALWAAALMAVTTPQIRAAQEARGYALLVMFLTAACAALAAVQSIQTQSRGRIAWLAAALGVCALGMMFTHYYGITSVLAISLYCLLILRGRPRRYALIAIAAAMMIFLAAWGPAMLRQRHKLEPNTRWAKDQAPGHVERTLMWAALAPARMLCDPRPSARPAATAAAILFVLPLFMLRRRPQVLLWWLILVTAVAVPLVLDLWGSTRQLEFTRFTIAASPPVCALIAALFAPPSMPRPMSLRTNRWRRMLSSMIPATAVVACLLALPSTYGERDTPHPDWRNVARFIDARSAAADILVFYDPEDGDPVRSGWFYLALSHYAHQLPPETMFVVARPLTSMEMEKLSAAHAVWLVTPMGTRTTSAPLPGFAHDGSMVEFPAVVVSHHTPPPKL